MDASSYQYTYNWILHAIPVHFTSPYSSTLEANHVQTVWSSLQGLSLDWCVPKPRASMRSTETVRQFISLFLYYGKKSSTYAFVIGTSMVFWYSENSLTSLLLLFFIYCHSTWCVGSIAARTSFVLLKQQRQWQLLEWWWFLSPSFLACMLFVSCITAPAAVWFLGACSMWVKTKRDYV